MVILALLSMTAMADNHIKLKWYGDKVIGGGHYGTVKTLSDKLNYEKGNLSNGTIVVDLKTIDVTDLNGDWKTKFLSHITSGDFFEVNKYPTAKLKINRVKNNIAYGLLTIKNVTKAVKIPYKETDKSVKGTLKFDRTKFNIVYGSNNFFKNLGDKAIKNEVRIDFNIKK